MTKKKKIQVLSGVLVVLCVITFGISLYTQKKEEIKTTGETIIELSNDDISSLTITYSNNELSLIKKDDVWHLENDEEFPIDNEKVSDLLSNFNNYTASFIIENVEDYGQYGLTSPEMTIVIKDKDDKTYTVEFGNYSNMDEKRYVNIGDGNVYLVNNDLTESFNIDADSLFLSDDIPTIDQAGSITVSGDLNNTIKYLTDENMSYNKEDVYYLKDGNKYLALNTTNVENYLKNSIASLDLSDYVTYTASKDDLSVYGLDDPDYTITIDYEEDNASKQLVLYLSMNPDDKEKMNSKDNDDTYYSYLRVGDSENVYKLSDYYANKLEALTYDDLRHSEIFNADFDEVYQIDISLDGENYSLNLDDDKWYLDEEDVDIEDLEESIKNLNTSTFDDLEETSKQEIMFTFHLNNDYSDEYKISLYRVNSSECEVRVNGTVMGAVSRSDVVDLTETVNAIVLN